ncbi:hypothetical protein X907_2321 [Glycocaulis alkaliphilus]|uniref:UPF0235 protein X907_2321 n=1 Tax=Glycocaulis alkaliphilus TaxID=1434191 RepID=A0A3T0EC08_9PROT|nr:DUF167 family protein [Glycocaulis alkaliphilus]AZU04836.1 hypothetical protein X907_2321 [Glycocaulis alkaliphilus]
MILRLRVTPKASKDAVEGVETGADGLAHLKVRVRAVPDKGAANAAVLKLLVKSLGVPKSALELVSGQTSRVKAVRVKGLRCVYGENVKIISNLNKKCKQI